MFHRFENYSQSRNVALEHVDAPWVFFVDADERSTPELAAEIRQVTAEGTENGWWVPRHNYLFGRLTLGAGWYPDYQMRLLRRGTAHYERPVHEIVVLEGEAGHLQNPLLHYNYENVTQFHAKQHRYSDYDARILFEKGIRARFYTPVTQSLRQFIWRYFTLEGYRDGLHGLHLCALMSWYEAVKYRKLTDLWAEQSSLKR
jgi:glycosyltransferase involved in cell wall biosynthesis